MRLPAGLSGVHVWREGAGATDHAAQRRSFSRRARAQSPGQVGASACRGTSGGRVSRAMPAGRARGKHSTRSSRPSLRVVRRKKRGLIKRAHSRKIAPALVLLGILIAATIGTILLEQVVLAQSAFKLSDMRSQLERAEEKHSQLLLQAAKLGSSERIKNVAVNDLGMVYPAQTGYIVARVHSNWTGRLAGSPTNAGAVGAAGGIAAQDAVLGAESP